MNLLRPAIGALGADYKQWRGLIGPLLKVGFRSSYIVSQLAQRGKRPRLVSWGMALFMGFLGVFTASTALVAPDPFFIGLWSTTVVALTVTFFLLMDFQAVAVSPMDYEALGHRPVNERTYLIARLTVTGAHQEIIAGLLAGPSVIACGLRFGWLPALGLALAAGLLTLSIVLALIGVYGALVSKVGARRLARSLAYAQFLLSVVYFLPMILFNFNNEGLQRPQALELEGWLLAYPVSWFASFVNLLHGHWAWNNLLASGLAVVTMGGLAWFARDKLSLSSAQKLSATLQADSQTGVAHKHRRMAGLLPARLSVAAILIRGQFRHDTRFRMSVLAFLPLLVFYVFMAFRLPGSLDPFVPAANTFMLFGIHLGVLMAPVVMLEELYRAESYRAGWLFYASPADRAGLAADARHCVTLFFFLPYLALAGIAFVWLFEAAWHALPHLYVLGCLGVLSMQCSQFVVPRLPFSMPPARKRHGVLLFVMILSLSVIGGALGPYLQFTYARPAWAIGTLAGLALCVAVMEKRLPRRMNRRLRWLEEES